MFVQKQIYFYLHKSIVMQVAIAIDRKVQKLGNKYCILLPHALKDTWDVLRKNNQKVRVYVVIHGELKNRKIAKGVKYIFF